MEQWGILELMGHVRLAGRISEEERYGSKLGRIDIPGKDGTFTTQFFSGSSIYRLTITTEEVARQIASSCSPAPIQPWEFPRAALPAPEPRYAGLRDSDNDEFDDDDDAT